MTARYRQFQHYRLYVAFCGGGKQNLQSADLADLAAAEPVCDQLAKYWGVEEPEHSFLLVWEALRV